MKKSKSYNCEGIVLSYRPYKENDKLVTILCKDIGRKTFIAKGALKISSSFGGKIEPITRIRFLSKGAHDLKIITEVKEISPFLNIKSRIEILKRVYVILEIIKKMYLIDRLDDEFYDFLISFLEIFEKPIVTAEIADCLLLSFKLNLLEVEGMGMNFEYCTECGSADREKFISETGEILCGNCSGLRRKFSISIFEEELNYLLNMREIGIRKRLLKTSLSINLRRIIDIFFRVNINIELLTEKYFKVSA